MKLETVKIKADTPGGHIIINATDLTDDMELFEESEEVKEMDDIDDPDLEVDITGWDI